MNKKTILPIQMGGTISSLTTESGATPGRSFGELLGRVKQSLLDKEQGPAANQFDIAEAIAPLGPFGVDSSCLTIPDIRRLIAVIRENYQRYDGFVITHGTNTMAFTASLLSFAIRNPRKPVVLTGAQRLLEEQDSDALTNLRDALLVAASGIGGVWLAFGGKVIQGISATKLDTEALDAFVSVKKNEQPIERFLRKPREVKNSERFNENFSEDVDILYLSQTITAEALAQYLSARRPKGLIVLVYGLGGHREELWEVLGSWVAEGNLVMAKSQCVFGRTDLQKYKAGRLGADKGILSAGTLSLEAAFAQLSYMIGNGTSDAGS